MSDNKWDEKLTEKFLTLYRRHECLWNPYSPDYKSCSVKNEAFETVVRELNVPGIRIAECLQQIEVIRERYKEEQARVKKGLKSGQLYDSKAAWFNLMSEMLCEVIRDEEKFDKNFEISNFVRADNCKRNVNDSGTYKRARRESHRPFYSTNKSDKSVVANSRREENNSRNAPLLSEEASSKERSAKSDEPDRRHPCDNCSSNGSDRAGNNEDEKTYAGKKIQFSKRNESGVRIEPESNVCCNDRRTTDNSNRRRIESTKVPETATQSDRRRTVGGKCVSAEGKEYEIVTTGDRGLGSQKGVETENNAGMSTEGLRSPHEETFDWDEGNDKPPEELGGDVAKRGINKSASSGCYESCSRHFGRDSASRFGPESDEARYNVSSKFKIVIPGPASEDQNFEITGYEVRSTNPRLRSDDYAIRYNRDTGERTNSSDSRCFCARKELSLSAERNVYNAEDTAGIVKLNINCKRSEDVHRRRSKEGDEPRADKKIQTVRSRGNETTRRGESGLNFHGGFLRDREISTDDPSSMNRTIGKPADTAENAGTSIASRKVIGTIGKPTCCAESREYREEASSSLSPGEGKRRFDNTKMVLNVIVRILEGDKTQYHRSNHELQRTLNTMLETFRESMSIGGVDGGAETPGNKTDSVYAPFNSTLETTEYQNLPPKIRTKHKAVMNVTNSRDTNGTTEAANSTSDSPEILFADYSDEIQAEEDNPMPFLPGEKIPSDSESVRSEGAGGRSKTPNLLIRESRDETIIEGRVMTARSGPPTAATLDNVVTRKPKCCSDPALNFSTSQFEGKEPVASSSRKTIEEPQHANQLAKDFLDIIRYTIMMDQILETSKNNGNDCRNESLPNQSSSL